MVDNEGMVTYLERLGLLSGKLKKVFLKVDRGCFVPAEWKAWAYDPHSALPVVGETTISAPDVVALMLSLLEVEEEHRVLDVGAGSGWTTCLLSEMAKEVVAIDVSEEALKVAERNMERCCEKKPKLLKASAYAPPKGPFDRILVSASAPAFPAPLLEELKEGGIAVYVEGTTLVKAIKEAGKLKKVWEQEGFMFVPLKEG